MDSKSQKPMSLRRQVKTEYRPFLREAIKGLDRLEILDSSIPESVSKIYEKLKGKGRIFHFLDLNKYEKAASRIKNHNHIIAGIIDELNHVSLAALYDDPCAVGKERLDALMRLTDKAREYHITEDNPYRRKIESIRTFVVHIQKVKEQWPTWDKLRSLQKRVESHPDYLKFQTWTNWIGEENEAREEASRYRHACYDFGSIPDLAEMVSSHNEQVVAAAMEDPLFENINGVALDRDQRRAALSGEDATLVIAGAGSGKTTTICGRVRYLLERQNVAPQDILLLSFSRKSAEDLQRKAESINSGLTVATFHKLGLDIIKATSGKTVLVEEQWDAIIEAYFRDYLRQDPEAMLKVFTYYGLFLNNGETKKRYASEGQLFEDLKKSEFLTFKDSLLKLTTDPAKLMTIKKERVKSFEEMAIANYLFINGIEYEYEKPYEFDESTPEKRQYQPDFYLPKYGIYYEHFGVDKDGRATQYEKQAEADYLRSMEWKNQCHARNKADCIETYSYQFADGSVFNALRKELEARGVEFRPLSNQEIQDALESVYEDQPFKSFINLVKSFLSLYKARYQDGSQFDVFRSQKETFWYSEQRKNYFLEICQSIYDYYISKIREDGKIDFDDMILKATEILPSLEGFRFRHIIVDEFQDISYSRMRFLQTLISHGNSSLFAVGDDWQSIYRFNGCDVGIFLNFEQYFGYAERHLIGNVHRNSQELQDAAKRFIEKNPEQIPKTIHSDKRMNQPLRAIYYENDNDAYKALELAFDAISKRNENAHVLLLGRNNKDITLFLTSRFSYDPRTGSCQAKTHPGLSLTYRTVHASKGLEEEYVILVSAKDGPSGFPNRLEDDPLLNMVAASTSQYPLAEERRLWYVALTRTKSFTIILAPETNKSSFLIEMEDDVYPINGRELPQEQPLMCPSCKTGHLVLRRKDGSSFYGCSNYPFCHYILRDPYASPDAKCPVCGDYLTTKHGRYGFFYACNNPRCNYKRSTSKAGKRKAWKTED